MAKLQFLRNQTPLDSKDLALTGLTNYVEKAGSTAVDGEIVLARYYTDSSKAVIKTMYGIVSVIGGKKSIDIFEDVSILGDYATKLDVSQTYIEKDATYVKIAQNGSTYQIKGIEDQVFGSITIPQAPTYTISEAVPELGNGNVLQRYYLEKNGTRLTDRPIEIYKDSALLGVGLTKGATNNLPTFNAVTKTFTAPTSGTLHDVLAFAYDIYDTNTKTWKPQVVVIDVADFLREAEFDTNYFKTDSATGKLQIKYPTSQDSYSGAQLLYGYELANGELNMETQSAKADLINIDTISDLDATNVQAALVKLNAKIDATSSAAIGIKAGDGIHITSTGDSSLQQISVKVKESESNYKNQQYLSLETISGDTESKGIVVKGINEQIEHAIGVSEAAYNDSFSSDDIVNGVTIIRDLKKNSNGVLEKTPMHLKAAYIARSNGAGLYGTDTNVDGALIDLYKKYNAIEHNTVTCSDNSISVTSSSVENHTAFDIKILTVDAGFVTL